MAIWYFIRVAPGDLRPVSTEEMEAFWRGQRPLPADESQVAHYVGLSVLLNEETPMDIENVWFARCTVKEDGILDQQTMLAKVNARVDIQRRIANQGAVWPPGQDVIDARDLFAARRLAHETRWDPTEADLLCLKELINTRAGWTML